tara:strand:- start:17 stop:184 length:168 start_codon:yes stop_codon:yes gene_type:complete
MQNLLRSSSKKIHLSESKGIVIILNIKIFLDGASPHTLSGKKTPKSKKVKNQKLT